MKNLALTWTLFASVSVQAGSAVVVGGRAKRQQREINEVPGGSRRSANYLSFFGCGLPQNQPRSVSGLYKSTSRPTSKEAFSSMASTLSPDRVVSIVNSGPKANSGVI